VVWQRFPPGRAGRSSAGMRLLEAQFPSAPTRPVTVLPISVLLVDDAVARLAGD